MNAVQITCRQDLFDAMINRKLVKYNGMSFYIQSIEMEDGSGYSFNLKIVRSKTHIAQMYYIRCKS